MIVRVEGREYDYQPYMDDFYEDKMKLRIQNNKSYKRVFQRNVTIKFINTVKKITNPNFQFTQNILFSVNAETGGGKSTMVISLGAKYFPHFSADNIFFFDQEILDHADEFPANTLLIRDENPSKGIFGQGSTRTAGQLVTLYETSRKAGLNLAFIEPEFQPNPIIKYYLSIVDLDLKNRITRCGLMESETFKYLGAVFIKILDDDDPILIRYEEKKDKFIEKMKKGDFGGSKLNYKEIARDMLADPVFSSLKNKAEKKAILIDKFQNITTGEVETILAMVNIIKREGSIDGAEKAEG